MGPCTQPPHFRAKHQCTGPKPPRISKQSNYGPCLPTVQCTDHIFHGALAVRMVMWAREKVQNPPHCETEPVRHRQEEDAERDWGGGGDLHTNCSPAFQSGYRHMKYELQLIFFLPGSPGSVSCAPLGLYLGSKLTSF